jgi:LytS/YehU family sensor histidine kinase
MAIATIELLQILQSDHQGLVTKIALFSVIPFIVAFAFIFFIFYKQNKQHQIKKQQVDLELKALRAQMNPHFVFNCLNSIYQCIQMEDPQKAGDYLLKFSFLLRRILENSFKRWISLEEEIHMLKAYLDLEKFRSSDKFVYDMIVDDQLDTQEVSTLMLITQPFVENSIWHGFKKEQTDCKISIHYFQQQDTLVISVRDNGRTIIDENAKSTSAAKRLSLGTALVQDQLKAVSELEKGKTEIQTEDFFDAQGLRIGREVRIYLPLRRLN